MQKENLDRIPEAESAGEPQNEIASPYETYRNQGGILGKQEYETAELFLEGKLKAVEKEKEIVTQIKNIAESAGISVSPEEVNPYGIPSSPRAQKHSQEAGQNGENEEGVHQMNDQELVAEVLRLTGRTEDLKKFKEYFGHIFEKK